MTEKIPYEDRQAEIRRELQKAAARRQPLTYTQLGATLGIPTRGPWKPILDKLSKEETEGKRPDITFMVVSARTGYPAQIGFRAAKPPDAQQIEKVRETWDALFELWAPARPRS
ncbi:MAG: hypothetical protein E7774_11570 [Bradyrhizobium sp.]|nr:MAG: hypothetical protein E7774_11570 [Bradyrhizobium sp.]